MPMIDLDKLEAHPANANIMPEQTLAKLTAHIAATGNYPPLIVRPHGEKYQLLDGHHRAIALQRLGYAQANCEVWDVDDEQASILLLTLNRLQGEDDPRKRGELLAHLRESLDMDELLTRVPDDAVRIEKLIALTKPPEKDAIAPPPDLAKMPQAVTFFMTGAQRRVLFAKLKNIAPDRSEALVTLLQLDETGA